MTALKRHNFFHTLLVRYFISFLVLSEPYPFIAHLALLLCGVLPLYQISRKLGPNQGYFFFERLLKFRE